MIGRAFRRGVLMLVAGLCSGTALADGIGQLTHFLKSVQGARGTFEQRVVSAPGAKPQVSAGSFALQRPGRFRWSYEKPHVQLLVSDGKTLWSYDPELKQVVSKALGKVLSGSPAEFLSGGDVHAHFQVSDAGAADGLEFIEALPRREGSGFLRLRMGLAGNLPAVMELHDSFGQVTLLRFTRFEANPALPGDTFRFTPPKGADVITE